MTKPLNTAAGNLAREAGALMRELSKILPDPEADEILSDLFKNHGPKNRPSRPLTRRVNT